MMVPLGIQYLSASLKEHFGDRVKVVIGDMGLIPQQTPYEPVVRNFLSDFNPDVVGLRGFSSQRKTYPLVAKIAKEVNEDCLVIAGGPHAATFSPHLFDDSNIDFVVPLEGEITLIEMVEGILAETNIEDVPGVYWNGVAGPETIASRPLIADLDGICFPDYTDVDIDAYQKFKTMTGLRPKGKATSLFTTRGCYFRCTYCHDHFGKKVRQRSLENVFDEMEFLMEQRGVTEFQIIDDIFNADRKRSIAFFNEVVRRNWKLSFAFPNGLRGDLITEEFVAAAKEAGTYHWAIAIESASPRIQKLVQKHNRLDRLLRAIELSDQYRIFTSTFVMLGFPSETREEMAMTIEYLMNSKAHISHMFHVQPFEGTPIREQAEDLMAGTLAEDLGFSHVPKEEEWFTEVPPEEIRQIIQDTYGRFHFAEERLDRSIELTKDCHTKPALAEFFHFCLHQSGYNLIELPMEHAKPKLAALFAHEGPVPYSEWQPPFRPELHGLA